MGRLVLVHGAWCTPEHWGLVPERLRALGHEVRTPLLHRGTLVDDTTAVQADVDELAQGGPVVVCGHSSGGSPVTGLRPDGIGHVVFMASLPLLTDENVFAAGTIEAPSTELSSAIVTIDDATTAIDPERAAIFFADCEPEDQAAALGSLRPQAVAAMSGSPARMVWTEVPVTCVVCTDDLVMHPELQRHLAERTGGAVVEWATGHFPQLSRPDLVIDLLDSLAE